jgi:hypothetical protein
MLVYDLATHILDFSECMEKQDGMKNTFNNATWHERVLGYFGK